MIEIGDLVRFKDVWGIPRRGKRRLLRGKQRIMKVVDASAPRWNWQGRFWERHLIVTTRNQDAIPILSDEVVLHRKGRKHPNRNIPVPFGRVWMEGNQQHDAPPVLPAIRLSSSAAPRILVDYGLEEDVDFIRQIMNIPMPRVEENH